MADFREYTPGLENTSQAHAQWKRSRGVPAVQLVISEVIVQLQLCRRKGGLRGLCGAIQPGRERPGPVRYALSDDEGRPGKWRFEGARIGAGETLLLRRDQLSFGISSGGETLLLSDNSLRPLDQMVVRPWRRIDPVPGSESAPPRLIPHSGLYQRSGGAGSGGSGAADEKPRRAHLT